ncbi:MAG: carbohydrate-binding domain-containing protein, partial [Planctomycetota bacterium]
MKRCLLLALLLSTGSVSAANWERPASEFANKTCGAKQGEFWNLWSNGAVSQWLRFPESGEYGISVVAYGSQARGEWPLMKVAVDLEPVQTVAVDPTRKKRYVFLAEVDEGVRRLSIAFLNDYYSPDRSEDRNLYLGRVTIRPLREGAPSPVETGPPEWRTEAETRIARHRMGDLILRIVDGSGKPVPEASVHVKMIRHAFPFGCAVSNGFVGGRWSAQDRARYGRRFAELFNCAVHENALKWGVVNRRGPEPDGRAADAIVAGCRERDIVVRGHCML